MVKDFFFGIKYFFEQIAFVPFDALRRAELENWWLANSIVWIMIAILFAFFFYWISELIKYDNKGTERNDATAHSYWK